MSRGGVARLSASGSNPRFGFVLVTPPTWHCPHDALNSLLPLFTCSGVRITVDPEESNGIVLVVSSKSIANAAVEQDTIVQSPKTKCTGEICFVINYSLNS